jgi:hypothetical protein
MRPSHRGSPPKRLGGLAPSRVAPWQSISLGKALTIYINKIILKLYIKENLYKPNKSSINKYNTLI